MNEPKRASGRRFCVEGDAGFLIDAVTRVMVGEVATYLHAINPTEVGWFDRTVSYTVTNVLYFYSPPLEFKEAFFFSFLFLTPETEAYPRVFVYTVAVSVVGG